MHRGGPFALQWLFTFHCFVLWCRCSVLFPTVVLPPSNISVTIHLSILCMDRWIASCRALFLVFCKEHIWAEQQVLDLEWVWVRKHLAFLLAGRDEPDPHPLCIVSRWLELLSISWVTLYGDVIQQSPLESAAFWNESQIQPFWWTKLKWEGFCRINKDNNVNWYKGECFVKAFI